MMKLFFGSLLSLFAINTSFSQQYKPTDQGSTVVFVIRNFGINTKGSFSGLDGSIGWNPTAS